LTRPRRSWGPVRGRPRRRLVLPHPEDASRGFHPGADAPPGDESVSERRISEVDRQGIIQHAACSRRRHSPAVGAAILVEPDGNLGMPLAETGWRNADPDADGKRRSPFVVISRGLLVFCPSFVPTTRVRPEPARRGGSKRLCGDAADGRASNEGSEAGSVPAYKWGTCAKFAYPSSINIQSILWYERSLFVRREVRTAAAACPAARLTVRPPSSRHVWLCASKRPWNTRRGADLSCGQTRPERLGTEPARAMLPTSGRTFRRTALGEPDTTTNRKNIRDAWAADAVFG